MQILLLLFADEIPFRCFCITGTLAASVSESANVFLCVVVFVAAAVAAAAVAAAAAVLQDERTFHAQAHKALYGK